MLQLVGNCAHRGVRARFGRTLCCHLRVPGIPEVCPSCIMFSVVVNVRTPALGWESAGILSSSYSRSSCLVFIFLCSEFSAYLIPHVFTFRPRCSSSAFGTPNAGIRSRWTVREVAWTSGPCWYTYAPGLDQVRPCRVFTLAVFHSNVSPPRGPLSP